MFEQLTNNLILGYSFYGFSYSLEFRVKRYQRYQCQLGEANQITSLATRSQGAIATGDPAITGGAMDSHEALPGPIYLQGSGPEGEINVQISGSGSSVFGCAM